jgi:hypothetical protein
LDDYLLVGRRKLKSIDVGFQVEVRYWAFYNHLQDYKIWDNDKNVLPKVFEKLVTTS